MSDQPLSANELAAQRTEMGFDRTVMALERTLMAWIRTSLSLISFGFTIYKFLESVAKAGELRRAEAPRNLGLFLIFLGMGVLILAILQFNQASKNLQKFSAAKPPKSLSFLTAVGVLIAGLFMLLNIFLGVGGF